jgi:hypothetical protein
LKILAKVLIMFKCWFGKVNLLKKI